MHTFRNLDEHLGLIEAPTVKALSAIDIARGRQEAFRGQNPAILDTLTKIARIQSTEASNAIEDIVAPHERIEALVEEKTTPENRSEEEIAGYRYVLDMIHSSAQDIPFTVPVIKQLHGNLYRFTSERNAGRFKIGPNTVEEERPDGSRIVVFDPVAPGDTEEAMRELTDGFNAARDAGAHHPLLLTGAYVFDYLMIHPFQDGNGRTARLLTLLALYHAGYEVGRFVSLEKLINETRQTYYEALRRSTFGWHDDGHDVKAWLGYFLGILIAAYREFEDRVGTVGGRGSKAQLVKQFIRTNVAETFTIADVRRAAPAVSDVYIGQLLRQLKDAGAIEKIGKGRGVRWRRVRSDF